MRLTYLSTDILTENVTRLIPHLRTDIAKYASGYRGWIAVEDLKARIDYNSYQQLSPHRQLAKNPGDVIAAEVIPDEMIEAVLAADPRYTMMVANGKTPEKAKAPFAKHIIRWWLSPESSGIVFPEDIPIVNETLRSLNYAKQKGFNEDITQLQTWDDVLDALEPYIDITVDTTKYGKLGFDAILEQGPWKVYEIDKWVPGAASSKYENQQIHAAFEGTTWCVKYENTFKRSYKPPYYLVLHRGKKFALIHLRSAQYKDVRDRGILQGNQATKAKQFLDIYFEQLPSAFGELFDMAITMFMNQQRHRNPATRYDSLKLQLPGNFAGYELDSRQTMVAEILSKSLIGSLAGRQIDLGIDKWLSDQVVVSHLQSTTSLTELKKASILAKQENATIKNTITAKARELVFDSPSEPSLFDYANICNVIGQPIDEKASQLLLKVVANPRKMLSWMRMNGMSRWPEGEAVIATDERAAKTFSKMFGRSLQSDKEEINEPIGALRALTAFANYEVEVSNDEIIANEQILLQNLDLATQYATRIKGRWLELEQELERRGTPKQQQTYNRALIGDDLYSQFGYN